MKKKYRIKVRGTPTQAAQAAIDRGLSWALETADRGFSVGVTRATPAQLEGWAREAKGAGAIIGYHLARPIKKNPIRTASSGGGRRRRRKAARRAASKTVARRNPESREVIAAGRRRLDKLVQQAVDRYAGFRGAQPQGVSKVQLRDPKVLLTVGECLGILYRTDRDGMVDNYIHRFKKSARPTLCCTSDGRQLYLLGGAYRMTDRGIEDTPK